MDHAHEKREACVEEQVVLDVVQQPRLGQVLDVGVPVLLGFGVGQGNLRVGLVWFGSVRFGSVRFGICFVLFCLCDAPFFCFDSSWCVSICLGLFWFVLVCLGLFLCGLARFRLVWFRLVRSGLVWLYL